VLEFVEKNKMQEVEETAQGLINQMQSNEEAILKIIDKKKYDEEMELLIKIRDQDAKMGEFTAISGDIDIRTSAEKGDF
jgi:RNA binding exosome subunit